MSATAGLNIPLNGFVVPVIVVVAHLLFPKHEAFCARIQDSQMTGSLMPRLNDWLERDLSKFSTFFANSDAGKLLEGLVFHERPTAGWQDRDQPALQKNAQFNDLNYAGQSAENNLIVHPAVGDSPSILAQLRPSDYSSFAQAHVKALLSDPRSALPRLTNAKVHSNNILSPWVAGNEPRRLKSGAFAGASLLLSNPETRYTAISQERAAEQAPDTGLDSTSPPQPSPIPTPQPAPMSESQPDQMSGSQPDVASAPQQAPVLTPRSDQMSAPQPDLAPPPQPTPMAASQADPMIAPQRGPVLAPQPAPMPAPQPTPVTVPQRDIGAMPDTPLENPKQPPEASDPSMAGGAADQQLPAAAAINPSSRNPVQPLQTIPTSPAAQATRTGRDEGLSIATLRAKNFIFNENA